ncbi:MAG: YrhB domain-containing protein [Anaerolineae bacterium]|nr:YrhB domain-containing protein [Anaerolineae bacterium]MDQ7035229.1 YrhB domain-containing protein [Anaerolineae bacterium]
MDKQDAITIAKKVLYGEIDMPDDDEFMVTNIEETDDGWLIECNSKRFIEDDDLMYALVIAPLLIHDDGSHRFVF